jgi:hypothetical protein
VGLGVVLGAGAELEARGGVGSTGSGMTSFRGRVGSIVKGTSKRGAAFRFRTAEASRTIDGPSLLLGHDSPDS